jgi:ABC-2 type transport system ATP-binding protein
MVAPAPPDAGLAATYAAPASAAGRVAVRVEHLTKRFPARRGWQALLRHPARAEHVTVMDDVSCAVRAGEFFGLLGPNGAGKTTLFRMLTASVTPDAGVATVHGLDVARQAREVRQLVGSVMSNERSLYWRLSARENLRLYAALQRIGGRAADQRIAELLHLVGLESAGDRMVGQYSSGMRQRLLIARALLPRPAVLLLDEPTRSLDPISARDLRSFLRHELAVRQECTILLATHDRVEAMELCDRVAVLDRGRLLAIGTAHELERHYGDDRYALWTTRPDHPGLTELLARGGTGERRPPAPDADGWTCVHLTIPGGRAAAARALDRLTCAGVPVAGFERVELPLAELLERVVGGGGAA